MSTQPVFVKVEILEGGEGLYSAAISFTEGLDVEIVKLILETAAAGLEAQ